MNLKLAYIITFLLAVALILVSIDKSESIYQLEEEKKHLQNQFHLLKSRADRQNLSYSKEIPLTYFYTFKGVEEGETGIEEGERLFLVFPSSACGDCFDLVLEEIALIPRLYPDKEDAVICITDLTSLEDVKARLKAFNVNVPIWVRGQPFPLAIDQPGYPYLFYGQVGPDHISVQNSLIPDNKDPDLTKSFIAQVSTISESNQSTSEE